MVHTLLSDPLRFKVPRSEATTTAPRAAPRGSPGVPPRPIGLAGQSLRLPESLRAIERGNRLLLVGAAWRASLTPRDEARFRTALGGFGFWESCLWATENAPFNSGDVQPFYRSALGFFRGAPSFYWIFLLHTPARLIATLPKGHPGAEAAGKFDAVYRLWAQEISRVEIRPIGDGAERESADLHTRRSEGSAVPPFFLYTADERPFVVAAFEWLGVEVTVPAT